MKYELPEGTRLALYNLLQQASKDGAVVAGFAFKADPAAITSFGNCSDHSEIKLYEALCQMASDKKKQGLVLEEKIEKPV
jgi:hypothetical protein